MSAQCAESTRTITGVDTAALDTSDSPRGLELGSEVAPSVRLDLLLFVTLVSVVTGLVSSDLVTSESLALVALATRAGVRYLALHDDVSEDGMGKFMRVAWTTRRRGARERCRPGTPRG